MPPEALEDDNPVYGTPIDVFSFGGIAVHVFSEEWPTPSGQKKRDPVTNKLLALTEAERRRQYLDKMVDNAAGLRKMVEQCLDDDPNKRPSIQEVSTVIKPLRVSTLCTKWHIYVVHVSVVPVVVCICELLCVH